MYTESNLSSGEYKIKIKNAGKPVIGSPFSFYVFDVSPVCIRNLQDKAKVNSVVKFDGKLILGKLCIEL